MNLALSLTLGRILLSPVFLIFYLYYQELGISLVFLPFVLITILLFAEISDLLDGFVARYANQVTELGKLLDPLADSMFRLSVFLTFTQGLVQLPLWLVLIFFYRDLMISTLRTICALRGVTLAARLSGKIKAVAQGICALIIILMMIPYSLGMLELELFQEIAFYLVFATVSYTVFSGIEYFFANFAYVKKTFGKSTA